MSRTGSHPRRTARLRRPPPSQALKNATSSAFFTHTVSAPLAPLMRARGQGQKNPTADARAAQAPRSGEVLGACAASRSPEVFRASVPRISGGCGGGRAMNACRRRRCLALAKEPRLASVSERGRGDEGASAARTAQHPENRRRTPAGGRRPAKKYISY